MWIFTPFSKFPGLHLQPCVATTLPAETVFADRAAARARYRTQLCNDGPSCTRRICFFAHSLEELRVPANKPFVPPEALAAASVSAALKAAEKAAAASSEASSVRLCAWPTESRLLVASKQLSTACLKQSGAVELLRRSCSCRAGCCGVFHETAASRLGSALALAEWQCRCRHSCHLTGGRCVRPQGKGARGGAAGKEEGGQGAGGSSSAELAKQLAALQVAASTPSGSRTVQARSLPGLLCCQPSDRHMACCFGN